MTRNLKKSKIQLILMFCVGCLFLGLSVIKLTASAEEKSTYYIKVNKLQNCVTVYEKDEKGKYTVPIKAMACSTGPATPLGTYNTLIKYRWKLLMGDVWGQYSTRIIKGILFHSVWYYKMDETTLSSKQYNKLGSSASHGCIRLTVADAKWIFDNCPVGTTVEVYSDKNPGPLGKPETMIIDAGTGWDPTDPSTENPYIDKTPKIIGAINKTIKWGTETNFLKGVKATSSTGTDITSKLKIESKVNIYVAGKYKINYLITDVLGKTKKKAVTITVKQCVEKPKIKGVIDKIIASDGVVDRKFALEGVTAYLSTIKLAQKDIKVSIVKTTEDTYTIKYKIIGKNKLIGTATAKVYIDTTAPVIEGITHKEITFEQLESGTIGIKKLALTGITVTDDYSKLSMKQVKVTVKAKEDYAYNVTYKVADDVGNITSETVQFTYFTDTKIDGVTNQHMIPFGTEITEEYVKYGITATNSEGDCTDKIIVMIDTDGGNKYIVTYSILNEEGNTISIVSYFVVEDEPDVLEDVKEKEEAIITPVETIPAETVPVETMPTIDTN